MEKYLFECKLVDGDTLFVYVMARSPQQAGKEARSFVGYDVVKSIKRVMIADFTHPNCYKR